MQFGPSADEGFRGHLSELEELLWLDKDVSPYFAAGPEHGYVRMGFIYQIVALPPEAFIP